MYKPNYFIILILFFLSIWFPLDVHGEETPKGNYVLISNESVDGTQTESSGTYNIAPSSNSNQIFKMDLHKPFYPPFRKTNLASKSYMMTSVDYELGSYKDFWVSNLDTNKNYQINAKLLYKGSKVNVWVHNNQISTFEAEKLGNEFDQKIYPTVTNTFAKEPDTDHDGKINILCLDIQDGFNGSGGYIGGYFYAGDLYPNSYSSPSNQSEIFYIDTYPGMGTSTRDVTKSFETLAHEFQHMVNYNQNVLIEGNKPMDVWLDEALAMAAEQAYSGKALNNRISYYNESSSIQSGHSLLYWDSNGDLLSNYSLSYLFGQYIKVQASQGEQVFKEILADSNNDYKAVENAVKKYINPQLSFGQFMTAFRGALLVNAPSGLYGFKGDTNFSDIKPKIYSNNSTTNLRGGGAIVKKAESNMMEPTEKGSDVTYTYYTEKGLVDITPPTKPTVNTVSDKNVTITGTAEPHSTVYVKTTNQVIGNSVATLDGSFKVYITKQMPGVTLFIYAEDASLNKSEEINIVVVDKTAPAKPTINAIGDIQKVITGKAEIGTTVHVKINDRLKGSSETDNKGYYSIKLTEKPKVGSLVQVFAEDSAGNRSGIASTKVIDKTPPGPPTISKVTSKSTYVYGKAEKGTTVYIYRGSTYLGKSTTDKYGKYKVKLKAQKKKVTLSIYAVDHAHNKSRKVHVIVY